MQSLAFRTDVFSGMVRWVGILTVAMSFLLFFFLFFFHLDIVCGVANCQLFFSLDASWSFSFLSVMTLIFVLFSLCNNKCRFLSLVNLKESLNLFIIYQLCIADSSSRLM